MGKQAPENHIGCVKEVNSVFFCFCNNPTSKRLTTPFLFLISFINGFQLRTIKRFCNKANEKRQNNKSTKFKIIKVESTPLKKLALISLSTSKRILERVLRWLESKTSSEKSKLNTYELGAEGQVVSILKLINLAIINLRVFPNIGMMRI